MLSKVNLQYLISYLGLFPFIIVLVNKYFFFSINVEVSQIFIIFYSNIIIVFIGALNWNIDKNINNLKVIYGFLPSLFSLIIIILYLNNHKYEVLIIFIMIFFIIQLFCDYLISYIKKINKTAFIYLRLPLTSLIILCLFLIK